MASSAAIESMAKALPQDYYDLATVARRGATPAVNVIGVVMDCMKPTMTRGSDLQMTMTIRDISLSTGFRVKFFQRSLNLFPTVHGNGDIILLRNLKIIMFAQELLGLSSFKTEFVVFPRDSIVSPAFRLEYAVPKKTMKYFAFSGAGSPTIHEQQWVITLNDQLNATEIEQPAATNPVPPSSIPSSKESVPKSQPISRTLEASTARNKFSLIKDIEGGDRGGGNRSGNFYDLAGEVVKMWSGQLGQGVLDLYITDYTSNQRLPDKMVSDTDFSEESGWKGPIGKMTLHIEVHPPHSVWTQHNVQEGQFVFLKNVRIKWNQRGLGSELEGNMWPDQNNWNRVNVSSLHSSHGPYDDLMTRKSRYAKSQEPKQTAKANKKRNKKRKRKDRAAMSAEQKDLEGVDSNKSDDENDQPANAELSTQDSKSKVNGTSNNFSSARKTLNPNVECDHHDKPYSSLDLILNNPVRTRTGDDGEMFEYPFTNVKHHTKLRVIDYYPHDLEKFSALEIDPGNSDKSSWQWRFWLVLSETNDTTDENIISVEVFGSDAEYLLTIKPCDLRRERDRLRELEETLFLLWGELGERKTKFLHYHPNIKPDASFAAREYNLSPENRPFDLCIAEYGKRVTFKQQNGDSRRISDSEDDRSEWQRAYKLFGTKIKR